MAPRGSAIRAVILELKKLEVGARVPNLNHAPKHIKPATWAVCTSQLCKGGVLVREGGARNRGYYRTTKDIIEADVETLVSVWRDATKLPARYKHKKNREGPQAPVLEAPPEAPPEHERIEIDPTEVFLELGSRQAFDYLVSQIQFEYAEANQANIEATLTQAAVEARDQLGTDITKLETELGVLRREHNGLQQRLVSTQSALLEERRKNVDLRNEVNRVKMHKPEVIEKRILIGAIPKGGIDSGVSGYGGGMHHSHAHSTVRRPPKPTGGGIVSVYRKKWRKKK